MRSAREASTPEEEERIRRAADIQADALFHLKNPREPRPGGAVYLNEKRRREVVTAYQKRKQEEAEHPLLVEKSPIGLLPHLQARLLARHLRGDLETYIPYVHA